MHSLRANGGFWEWLSITSFPYFLMPLRGGCFSQGLVVRRRYNFFGCVGSASRSACWCPPQQSAATLCARASRQSTAHLFRSRPERCSWTSRSAFLYRRDSPCLDLCCLSQQQDKRASLVRL